MILKFDNYLTERKDLEIAEMFEQKTREILDAFTLHLGKIFEDKFENGIDVNIFSKNS